MKNITYFLLLSVIFVSIFFVFLGFFFLLFNCYSLKILNMDIGQYMEFHY